MNNIVFDIGNTNIVIGVFTNNDKKTYRFNTYRDKTCDEYSHLFNHILKDFLVDEILISSVVPVVSSAIYDYCLKYLKTEAMIIGPGYKTGIKIKTDNPREVGSDLICGIVGAMQYSSKGIVIDLGTATKLSLFEDNTFKGVIIAPGINIAAESLINGASLLSDFALEKPGKLFGTNTIECLQSGVVFGHIAMLNGFIEMIKLDYSDYPIYLTGGLSSLMLEELNFSYKHCPDLIIDAMNLLIYKNKELK